MLYSQRRSWKIASGGSAVTWGASVLAAGANAASRPASAIAVPQDTPIRPRCARNLSAVRARGDTPPSGGTPDPDGPGTPRWPRPPPLLPPLRLGGKPPGPIGPLAGGTPISAPAAPLACAASPFMCSRTRIHDLDPSGPDSPGPPGSPY